MPVRSRLLLPLLAVLAIAPALPAMQMQDATFYSPITNQPFPVITVPATRQSTDSLGSLADMGTDDDGCRHDSGGCEYDYYIATDPYSYFSAITQEWNERTGRFVFPVDDELKDWVKREFNSDWQIDSNHAFQNAQAVARASGQAPPDRSTFVMDQRLIPVEKRYRYALLCYEKRGARPGAIAKVALSGAWALRCKMQVPITDPRLTGGVEEINDKIQRQIADGNERFVFDKWYGVYRDVFENARLTNAAYVNAGLVYSGMAVRAGDRKAALAALEKMTERFKDLEPKDNGELLRGLVRARRRQIDDYERFLNLAAVHFTRAVANEEFPRQRLPEVLLVVAEALRRTGREAQSMDWYVALAQMAETQPKLRDDMRKQKRAPSADAPYQLQLGWIADRLIDDLAKAGTPRVESPTGSDKGLLSAILFERLGTGDYKNPNWKPVTGATTKDLAFVLNDIGKAVMETYVRTDHWPLSLDALWESGVIPDRNRYNRFYDPVIGKPFLYTPPPADLGKKTVIVATSEAIDTDKGKRWFAYLADDTIESSSQAQKPGTPFVP